MSQVSATVQFVSDGLLSGSFNATSESEVGACASDPLGGYSCLAALGSAATAAAAGAAQSQSSGTARGGLFTTTSGSSSSAGAGGAGATRAESLWEMWAAHFEALSSVLRDGVPFMQTPYVPDGPPI